MMLQIKERQEWYWNRKVCYICKETFEDNYRKNEKYRKVRDHCHDVGEYIGAADSICNLKYSISAEIPVAFQNGSNHDYHFIIKN